MQIYLHKQKEHHLSHWWVVSTRASNRALEHSLQSDWLYSGVDFSFCVHVPYPAAEFDAATYWNDPWNLFSTKFSSVQLLSRVWLFANPWTTAHQASQSITNSWSLPRLMSIDSVMPSNHLTLCHPLLLLSSIFPSIRVFSSELALPIRWPKYWSFSFRISPSNEYSGLISFRIDFCSPCSPRDSQESSPTPQLESIHSLALSFLYGPSLTSVYDYWKNHSFD